MATPSQIALSNQSLVFEMFDESEKLTIREATDRVNVKLRELQQPTLSEQTVRRAITGLVKSGFLREYGKQHNAMLYGRLSASWAASEEGQPLVPLAGNLVSVPDFLRLMVDEEAEPYPFIVKVKPENWAITDEFQRKLRKRMAHVILNTSPGYSDALETQRNFLNNHITELRHMIQVMESFLDSPIWYAQYRDRMAYEVRRTQEKNPELFKLAVEYVTGGDK
ncbi:hypothetical protein [Streptomyces griseosporeus]|uniref:hypothetical protein n=1 Tax=Streptomyces griseosporeus TaxID=1910 RepID=UPI00167C7B6E|nr:hypothetical protein [Streptomyces griseosporeus]GHF92421.1 hypothetical protein GCM10018783_74170 [Streptomyces griseosporeus]